VGETLGPDLGAEIMWKGAYLADFLEDGHDEAQVAGMEGRQRQLYVSEVTGTVAERLEASRAQALLVGDTLGKR
jgi:hypothetical protein